MATTTPTEENVSAHNPRPRYVYIGEDTNGGTHLYRTVDETIFAFDASGRFEFRFDVDARTVDHYVAHVKDSRGWYDLVYGWDAFCDRFAEAV